MRTDQKVVHGSVRAGTGNWLIERGSGVLVVVVVMLLLLLLLLAVLVLVLVLQLLLVLVLLLLLLLLLQLQLQLQLLLFVMLLFVMLLLHTQSFATLPSSGLGNSTSLSSLSELNLRQVQLSRRWHRSELC